MKVILYGTLSRHCARSLPGQEMDVEIPGDGTVQDLLTLLNIPESLGPVVTMEGRILKASDRVRNDSSVVVFQALHGG
ncbi:MAG: hypothetical protein AB1512_01255 [Thermodesulfobacteriota bacterium]